MKKLTLILLIFNLAIQSPAQKGIRTDSSRHLAVRHFSAGKMKSFREDSDFQYDRDRRPVKTLWQRFVEWFWRTVDHFLGTKEGQVTYKALLLILSIAVLSYVVLRLAGMSRMGMFSRGESEMSLNYKVGEEDIHELDFDEALARAESTGNYRMGIRLLYLQTLKLLSDKQLINWQINKTNTAYAQELAGSGHSAVFKELTLDFEYCWYGERQVSKEDFSTLKEQFRQFNRQL